MCGIVGFTGTQQAAPILLNGLSKLEYRGYDSAGIAVRDGERLAQVVKAKGRLGNLIEKTDEGIWQLKEGIDETTVSADDYSKATSDIANLNAWEKQVS